VELYYEPVAAGGGAGGDAATSSSGGSSQAALTALLEGQALYLLESLGQAPKPLSGKPAGHPVLVEEVTAVGGEGAEGGIAFRAVIAVPDGSSALRLLGKTEALSLS
jgi:hypothetical protein